MKNFKNSFYSKKGCEKMLVKKGGFPTFGKRKEPTRNNGFEGIEPCEKVQKNCKEFSRL